jgi:uncharacterized spore protein YtfJ
MGSDIMDESVDALARPLEQMLERMDASMVFGKPEVRDDVTVIPVAEVMLGLGFGSGPAGAAATPGATVDGGSDAPGAVGIGRGGGGGGRVRPVGVLKIAADGVHYEPIVDVSRIALAGIVLAGWIAFWVTFSVRAVARAFAAPRRR